jgi:secreted trypsin-like serine protease
MNILILSIVAVLAVTCQAAGSCGKPKIEPFGSYNSDGTIKGGGISHNVQGIVNGQDAKTHSIPWQVLIITNGRKLCGGSILNKDYVVTAAHCIAAPGSVYKLSFGAHNMYGGEDGRLECEASQVKKHEGYNSRTKANDIALLKIKCSKPLRFSKTIQPICLPSAYDNFGKNDVYGMVSGWGTTKYEGSTSQTLKQTVLKMHTFGQCSKLYGRIPRGSLCGSGQNGKGNTDSCQGDSGGPLAVRKNGQWKLAGVVSYGDGCAKTNKPGVYVHVPDFVGWLRNNMN